MEGSRKFGSGRGQGYGMHGYKATVASASSGGSVLGGLGTLIVWAIGLLVLAQAAMPVLGGLLGGY